MSARLRSLVSGISALLLLSPAVSAVPFDWVTVGDPGNACDPQLDSGGNPICPGAVGSTYQISKYEVSNAQYAAFLAAVAVTDTNGLYYGNMGSDKDGGITQTGASGSYVYAVKPGYDAKPVNFVDFYDTLRFANWLYNGEPTGAQNAGSTEDGAYTITAQGITDNSITRNPGATLFLTSEDEWYKAAYYDAVTQSYFDYPAGSDIPTLCAAPGSPLASTPNTGHCGQLFATGLVADGGSYPNSASPSGTFDQGGNVWEWNEAILVVGGEDRRGQRGGSYIDPVISMRSMAQNSMLPADERYGTGFRIARLVPIPEPGTELLVATGMIALAARRRRRA